MGFALCPVHIFLQITILEECIIKCLKLYSQKNIQHRKKLLNLILKSQSLFNPLSPHEIPLPVGGLQFSSAPYAHSSFCCQQLSVLELVFV